MSKKLNSTTIIEDSAPHELAQADLRPRGYVHPSPINWRDQILYQLLPDRFSDGYEYERELFDRNIRDRLRTKDKSTWMGAGNQFTGGTLKGIQSKLDYLQGLGVTTLWINPPWRQRSDLATYHGYGIQNFLDVDPRFGTRQDLRNLVDAAHDRGMYVILDIIFNHSGNNWFYRSPEDGQPKSTMPYRFSPPYPIHGWRSGDGQSIAEPEDLDDSVWPVEFQNPNWYTRSGEIGNWGLASWEDPQSSEVEFRRGDFYDLKDLNLENGDALRALTKVYQYWIALTDCDGFRVDAIKHVSVEQSRRFCGAIHEYAEAIGKENFLLVGEITDTEIAQGYIDFLGRNLDAVLGIVQYPNKLGGMVKGLIPPSEFFDLYRLNRFGLSARQLGRFIVTVLDDHDMSSRARKERFAAHGDVPYVYLQAAHVVGVQLTTPGIPAIYYGTEQAFDGSEEVHDYRIESRRYAEDRYVRESMHGRNFGAFETEGVHFFNPDHPTYLRIAAITKLRNRADKIGITLRRGHPYLRETSFCGNPFAIPGSGELVAWSQIHFETEILMALNTHHHDGRGADVTVDAALNPAGTRMSVLYKSDWNDEELRQPPQDQSIVVHHDNGRAFVQLDLPPAGMVILAA